MTSDEAFAEAISHSEDLNEVGIAIALAWYLSQTGRAPVTITSLCDFTELLGIRQNLNRSRLQKKLNSDRRISAPKGGPVTVNAATRKLLQEQYKQFLEPPKVKISDTVLEASDFVECRKYIQSIVYQINATCQFELYDACAVMMRRLSEVLIIDAYEAKDKKQEIVDQSGHYQMMSGLISALTSGRTFRLSRNAPKALDSLKDLGDNAAHSRTYITKPADVIDFAPRFRRLISELLGLAL